MRQYGVSDALTTDRHFEQEGFPRGCSDLEGLKTREVLLHRGRQQRAAAVGGDAVAVLDEADHAVEMYVAAV
jgi:hypothetical protein